MCSDDQSKARWGIYLSRHIFSASGVFLGGVFLLPSRCHFYALSLVGASVFTLAVQGRSIGGMPRWLSIALWIPTWLFLLVIAGMAVQLGVHRLFGV